MESNWRENVELFGVGGYYFYSSQTQLFGPVHITMVAELITPTVVFGKLVTHVAQVGDRGPARFFAYGILLDGKVFTPVFDWIFVTGRGFPYFACHPD